MNDNHVVQVLKYVILIKMYFIQSSDLHPFFIVSFFSSEIVIQSSDLHHFFHNFFLQKSFSNFQHVSA